MSVSQSVSLSDRKEGWKEEGKPPERFVLLAQNREIMDIRQGIPSVNQKSHWAIECTNQFTVLTIIRKFKQGRQRQKQSHDWLNEEK